MAEQPRGQALETSRYQLTTAAANETVTAFAESPLRSQSAPSTVCGREPSQVRKTDVVDPSERCPRCVFTNGAAQRRSGASVQFGRVDPLAGFCRRFPQGARRGLGFHSMSDPLDGLPPAR